MKKIILYSLIIAFAFTSGKLLAQHNAGNNGKVLLIASNPAISKQTGWPIGVWAAEVIHPYWEFSVAGYAVDIASPDGGEIKIDGFSDPEDASGYAAWDFLSLGFLKDTTKASLFKHTLKLSEVNPNDYKAIMVCGGQGPMYTFIDNQELQKFFVDFYLTGKPTAAICHGTCILLKTKLPNGKYLVDGKTWTGFANSEENYADAYVGKQIQPFRIEDLAHKIPNTHFVVAPMFEAHAIEDGNLITGQQQNSGADAAKLIIRQLAENKARYPTYVLVHGAWSDESAWSFIRNDLAIHANVVTVNLPAHGADNTYGAGVGLNDYVKKVTEAVNQQSGKVILVGHSMAGIVISQVAENLPDKIEKLVYVAAYIPKNGESIIELSKKDNTSKVGAALEYNKDYSLATIKKEVVHDHICADCPDYMKDILVKYHRAEPTKALNDKAILTKRFASVPKYYISTIKDEVVPYTLQQKMIKDNGTFKKVFELPTSHLPFVTMPQDFLNILKSIRAINKEDILGNWKSETIEDNGNGTYGKREFSFTDQQWTVKFTLYLDKAATKPVFTFRGIGKYELNKNSSTVPDATNAVFHFANKYLTLKTSNPEIIKKFGLNGLQMNIEKDISINGFSFFESNSACGQEYDLVSLKKGKLYLGARPQQGKSLCSEDNRPVTLGFPLVRIK